MNPRTANRAYGLIAIASLVVGIVLGGLWGQRKRALADAAPFPAHEVDMPVSQLGGPPMSRYARAAIAIFTGRQEVYAQDMHGLDSKDRAQRMLDVAAGIGPQDYIHQDPATELEAILELQAALRPADLAEAFIALNDPKVGLSRDQYDLLKELIEGYAVAGNYEEAFLDPRVSISFLQDYFDSMSFHDPARLIRLLERPAFNDAVWPDDRGLYLSLIHI